MRNLYIFWDEPLNLTAGGVHRCIACLMQYLPQNGYNVYYIYSRDYYNTFHLRLPDNKERFLTFSELRQYLIDNRCDIILGQEAVFSSTLTRMVKRLELPNVKFINQYHNTLLFFDKKLSPHYLSLMWQTNKNWRDRIGILFRGLIYPFWKKRVRNRQNAIYKYNYDNSDVSLLLSEYEKPIMTDISGDKDAVKCAIIHNPLSWEYTADENILNEKQKEVLIVSRIYNFEKRIDRALKVWKFLQDKGLTSGWTLRIVGDGIHKEYLMNMTASMRLSGVRWEGRQDPISFYKKASIFLLTSTVEGWALTLTESMQMGVVPIALDSYPAVRSIITDGYDGCLVAENNLHLLADKLYLLMSDAKLRRQMAINGLQSCQRFTIDKIINQWCAMLNRI